jgi:Domain of unknown function DUF29
MPDARRPAFQLAFRLEIMMGRTAVKKAEGRQPPTRYEDDLYTWVQEQVALLRAGRLSEIDAVHVAEELADVGNEQLDKLESAIAVLTQHLLKWDYQQQRRSRSWQSSVNEQRRRIERVLKKSSGLRPQLGTAIEVGYADGRDRAVGETDFDYSVFPQTCPYTFDEMVAREVVFVPKIAAKRARRRPIDNQS